jgi:hypothetical protein
MKQNKAKNERNGIPKQGGSEIYAKEKNAGNAE